MQRLGTQIWRASEGNPFMVVETMRALYGTDAFEAADELPTPPRVRDIIAARLDRLSQRGRDLTALASVIGREFDFALLERAAGADGQATAAAVEELVARHVLHVVDERLDFTHDRIREVAYEKLLAPRRTALARGGRERPGVALRERSGASLRGPEPALPTAARCGTRRSRTCDRPALRRAIGGAHREAVACFDQALAALQHLPESRTALEQSIDLRFALRNSLAALGEYEPLLAHLRAAEATAQRPR